MLQHNFVERRLPEQMVATVAFVGSRGLYLPEFTTPGRF
jgi:hypothetical protein